MSCNQQTTFTRVAQFVPVLTLKVGGDSPETRGIVGAGGACSDPVSLDATIKGQQRTDVFDLGSSVGHVSISCEEMDSIYDVIVVGGGAAGVGAAMGARQALPNGKILVIESEGCLGGAATHRGVFSYCGLFTIEPESRRAVRGVWEELRSRLLELGATPSHPVRHRGIFQVSPVVPASNKAMASNIALEGCRARGSEVCAR